MKQYFSVALAVLFCALMPAACTTQTTAVKFMSYNIRNGRGADDVQDLGRIAEVIGRVAPDVVALQEVDSVTGRMNGIPFAVIFTKADKLSKTQREKSVERYRAALAEQWEELPRMFVSSSQHSTGREEILGFIGECLNV